MSSVFRAMQLSPALGAKVTGFDLRQPLSDEGKAELRVLLDEHHLLMFPDQTINAEQQAHVLSSFGRVCDENGDGILHTYVSNVRPDGLLGTRGLPFHSDFSFTPFQPPVLSLYGAEIVGEPEPTMYVNCAGACARLPESIRHTLSDKTAMHVHDYSVDGGKRADHGRVRLLEMPSMPPYATHPRAVHPVLRKLPRTGKPILGVSQFHTSHIEGMSSADSEAIIQDLFARLYAPANVYVHRWKQNDLVVWDNIAVQHGRTAFEGAAKAAHRTLCRVSVSEKSVVELMEGVTYNSTGGFKVGMTATKNAAAE